MRMTISAKVKTLVFSAVISVAAAICVSSFFIFNMKLLEVAREEIAGANSGVRKMLGDRQDQALGYAAFVASRPDLSAAISRGDGAGIKALLGNAISWLGSDFIVITDASGVVLARSGGEPGDSILGRAIVGMALEGVGSSGFEVDFEVPLALCAGFPVYAGSEIVGTVQVGFDLSTEAFVDSVKADYSVDCSLFRGETCASTTIASHGKRLVGMPLSNPSARAALTGDSEGYEGYETVEGVAYDCAYWKISDTDGKAVGVFFVGKNLGIIRAVLWDLIFFSIAITAVAGLLVFAGSTLFVKRMVRPIWRATAMLKDISVGSGDLTKRLEISTTDEIGVMSGYFNKTLDAIRDLVAEIERQAGVLTESGSALSSNMEESAAAIRQISSNIESVRAQTVNQSASVTATGSAIGGIRNNIGLLNGFIVQQTDLVARSSSSIEQMIAIISSVADSLVTNTQNVRDLSIASAQGKSDLGNVSDVIREISEKSESLIEISGIIEGVASKTNLLAMNAAIEAAHAGNAGKGFAVVADEIRTLAESSSAQVKTITGVLATIKNLIDRVTRASDVVQGQFAAIDEKIALVSQMDDSIRASMEEQRIGSMQILEAIGQLNDITSKVRNGSDEMLVGSNEVAVESANLGRITAEVSGSIDEMATGISQISISVNEVNDATLANKESIETLARQVGKFRIR